MCCLTRIYLCLPPCAETSLSEALEHGGGGRGQSVVRRRLHGYGPGALGMVKFRLRLG